MPFALDQIVPWGRCLEEYRDMFLLTSNDLSKKIIGIGDGPASFNYEASKIGANITSVDPVYQFSKAEIKKRIDETYSTIMKQLIANQDQFVWEKIKSPDELGRTRLNSMNMFLEDFESGLEEKRYIPELLPQLTFNDDSFDLALVSHLLFLYSDQLELQLHIDSIVEIMRISREARIFPLIKLDGNRSHHIDKVIDTLQNKYEFSFQKTNYHFQKGAFEMLVIKNKE